MLVFSFSTCTNTLFLFDKVQSVMENKIPLVFDGYFPLLKMSLNIEVIPLDEETFACILMDITEKMENQAKIEDSRKFLKVYQK